MAGSGTTVVFAGTTTLSGTASEISFYNLTIQPGCTLNAPSRSVSVYGNWVNNGTFAPGTGTIAFAGSENQTLTGNTTFNNLIVSSGNTLDAGTSVANFNTLTLLNRSSTREVRVIPAGPSLATFNLAQSSVNVKTRGNLTQLEVVRHETNQQITTNLNYGFLLLP